MFPRRHISLAVNRACELVIRRWPVKIVLHIVFARPQYLNGLPGLLRYLSGLGHKVAHVPASKSTAHQRGMHFHRFLRQSGNLRNDVQCPLRRLRRHPGFRAVRAYVNSAIHRFHRGMGEKRRAIDGFNFLRGACNRRQGIPVLNLAIGSRCP